MNWGLILISYAMLIALGLIDSSRGPAYPLILEDLRIGPQKGSSLFVLTSAISLLVNFTSKIWLPKLGIITSSRLGLSLMSISAYGLGHAGKIKSFSHFLFFSLILGISFAICSITMNILTARGASDQHRKQALSGLHSMYGLASLTAPLLLTVTISFNHHWSYLFKIVSIIPIMVLFLTFSIGKNTLKEQRDKRPFDQGIKKRTRALFGAFFGCYVTAEVLVSSRLTLFLQSHVGLNPKLAQQSLSLFFLGLLVGRLLFSFKNFKVSNIILLRSSLLMSLFIFFIAIFFIPKIMPLLGLSMSFFFAIAFDFLVSRFGKHGDYMTTSVMTTIGISIAIGHSVFGTIADQVNVFSAMFMIPTLLLITFVLTFKINSNSNYLK